MRYRWFADESKEKDEFGMPVSRAEYDEALQRKTVLYHRGELLAIAIAAVIMLYEWVTDDRPLLFVCLSFLVFELRPLARYMLGANGRAIGNMLTGFSLAMFVATLMWTFF